MSNKWEKERLVMAPGDSGGSVLSWTISDVRAWLTELGMARYAKVICDQHRVDGPALLMIQVTQTSWI